MTFPFARKSLVVKTLDGTQTLWPRNASDVLPYLVTFQYLDWNGAGELLINSTVFFNSPHAILWIYYI